MARRVIDLSHPLGPDTPVFPGTPAVRLKPLATVAEQGYAERLLTLASHTGTHIDAPAHVLAGGLTLDRVQLERLVGPACVLDLTSSGPVIGTKHLEAQAERLAGCRIVLLHTGWDRHWGTPDYLQRFPVLSTESAQWLAASGVTALGVDAISFDPVDAPELPVHRILLAAGVVLIENLTALDQLPPTGFTCCCLPLSFVDADGAPCRAVAILDICPPEGGARDFGSTRCLC